MIVIIVYLGGNWITKSTLDVEIPIVSEIFIQQPSITINNQLHPSTSRAIAIFERHERLQLYAWHILSF
jgi:hypothetical protein